MIAPLEADEGSWTKLYIITLWRSSTKQAENLSYMRTNREGGMTLHLTVAAIGQLLDLNLVQQKGADLAGASAGRTGST
jgi:hypothetical protein